MVEVTQAAALRFWAKADIRGEDECWEWMGAKSSYGYGRFYIARRFRSDRDAAEQWRWCLFDKEDFDPLKQVELDLLELAKAFAAHRLIPSKESTHASRTLP